ncbi:MAG: hypothetical protein AAGF67_14080, partial [Verrucomicrobiota bacterium]
MKEKPHSATRRRFLASSSLATAGFSILGCKKTAEVPKRHSGWFVGEGEHRYEVIHDWVSLPDKYTWQITHNVAVDNDGCLYVIHEG